MFIRYCVLRLLFLEFLEKNPTCLIIRSCAFIEVGILFFLLIFFWIFLPKISLLFSLFRFQFNSFSPFLYCLVNYRYTSKNYIVRLFNPVHLLKFGVFPSPALRLFHPERLLKLGDLPPCALIPDCAFIKLKFS